MSGDRDAFGMLATQSLPRLVGTAGLILGRLDLAEDAVQESLVRAWRDLPSLRDPDRFEAWLYRVVVRACHDEFRRARRGSTVELTVEPVSNVGDPVAAIAERDAIGAGLRRISLDQRTVLVLRYYLDLSYEEMGKVLNCSMGTVASRLNRAHKVLERRLARLRREGGAGRA